MTKTKLTAAALTALTLAAGMTAATSQAQAGYKGTAIGLGIAAGVLATAAIASTASPSYVVVEEPAYRCHWRRQYNVYGQYVGSVKVCHGY